MDGPFFCNRSHIDSKKDEPPSHNRSIRSWTERCQSEDGKSDIEKQRNENNYAEHVQKNLSDLANRLNGLTLQGTDKKKETYIEITTVPQN